MLARTRELVSWFAGHERDSAMVLSVALSSTWLLQLHRGEMGKLAEPRHPVLSSPEERQSSIWVKGPLLTELLEKKNQNQGTTSRTGTLLTKRKQWS